MQLHQLLLLLLLPSILIMTVSSKQRSLPCRLHLLRLHLLMLQLHLLRLHLLSRVSWTCPLLLQSSAL